MNRANLKEKVDMIDDKVHNLESKVDTISSYVKNLDERFDVLFNMLVDPGKSKEGWV